MKIVYINRIGVNMKVKRIDLELDAIKMTENLKPFFDIPVGNWVLKGKHNEIWDISDEEFKTYYIPIESDYDVKEVKDLQKLTVKEYAKRKNVSKKTVYSWIKKDQVNYTIETVQGRSISYILLPSVQEKDKIIVKKCCYCCSNYFAGHYCTKLEINIAANCYCESYSLRV